MEIIQDTVNGFYITPMQLQETAQKILNFVQKCDHHPDSWQEISQKAIERVYSTYSCKHSNLRILVAEPRLRRGSATQLKCL